MRKQASSLFGKHIYSSSTSKNKIGHQLVKAVLRRLQCVSVYICIFYFILFFYLCFHQWHRKEFLDCISNVSGFHKAEDTADCFSNFNHIINFMLLITEKEEEKFVVVVFVVVFNRQTALVWLCQTCY